ncbi:MAG: hypothetical protein FWD70_04035 [Desulfuromonadales bacterium]|nr:hypothetical protein [Desulfuromonadales bacterium]
MNVESKIIRKFAKYAIVVFATIILLTSCAANLGSYDPTALPTTQCTLIVKGTLNVIRFDGEKVDWKSGWFAYGRPSHFTIRIPAGAHTFLINYREFPPIGNFYYSRDGIRFNGNFEAGKEYIMGMDPTGVYIIEKPQKDKK